MAAIPGSGLNSGSPFKQSFKAVGSQGFLPSGPFSDSIKAEKNALRLLIRAALDSAGVILRLFLAGGEGSLDRPPSDVNVDVGDESVFTVPRFDIEVDASLPLLVGWPRAGATGIVESPGRA